MPVYVQGTEFKPDRINLPQSASDPAGSHELGDIYFNTTDKELKVYRNVESVGMGFTTMYGGGAGQEWEVSTGTSYQGGLIRKINSTTYQCWYYPQSRKGQSVTYSMSNLTGGSFQIVGQTNMTIAVIGGGGGGIGENACGGSGGGGIIINSFTPVEGETFTFTVGKGGRGGWSSSGVQFTGCPGVGENGQDTSLSGTGFQVTAGGGPANNHTNQNDYSSIGSASCSVNSNSRGLSITTGSHGRGGSRGVAGQGGLNGTAGGGGGNNYGNAGTDDSGGNGSGNFSGGGGAGNGYDHTWTTSLRPGGVGALYGFNGGYGGGSQTNDYGQSGRCPADFSGTYPNFHAGGGRAYEQADWGSLSRGSSGGGGFPGGGGGSSYYQPYGIGSDGASGAVVFHWTL